MYSPASPRKTAKGSPRKPLLSPSELTPFSFSTDNLHLFDEEQQQVLVNEAGIVPMSSLSMSRSQPRTPVAKGGSLLSPQSAPGGRSYSFSNSFTGGSASGTAATSSSIGSSGSIGVREYDGAIRDLKKENFNLKLRIYFLEERLGTARIVAQAGSKEELVQKNLDLKVQVESLKYDVKDKAELLTEAGRALDELETKLTSLASEREEERLVLEDKLKGLEEPPPPGASSGTKTTSSVTDDENLIDEVERELRESLSLSCGSNHPRPLETEKGCQTDEPQNCLSVVIEHKHEEHLAARVEELEQSVEQLTIVISDTEACLQEATAKSASLENELAQRDTHIEGLARESRLKAEAAVKAQKELADLASRATDQAEESEAKVKAVVSEREALVKASSEAKQELLSKIKRLQEIIEDKDQELKRLYLELEQKSSQLEIYREVQEATRGCADEANTSMSNNSPTSNCCSSPDGAYKIVHQSVPSCQSSPSRRGKNANLNIVTQTLHIPPSSEVADHNLEVEKMRKEIKKLKEYLKTSVQERKVLIHKIGALKERVDVTHARKSMSPARQTATLSDCAVQCNLVEQRNYWQRFACLQKKLVTLSEAADLMKTQLEATVDLLEPASREIRKMSGNVAVAGTLQNMAKSSRELLETLGGLNVDLSSSATDSQEGDEPTPSLEPQSRPDSSISTDCLPDPKAVLDEGLVQRLRGEIANQAQEIRHQMFALESLGDQLEQKDSVIREQAEYLDEYRMEVIRLRDEQQQNHPPQVVGHHHPYSSSSQGRRRHRGHHAKNPPEGSVLAMEQGVPEARALTEEEDSWSEPDVDASRKRMGLSHHVLTLIEKTGVLARGRPEESSERDEQRHKQRLKSFYALDYTEQDFNSDDPNSETHEDQASGSYSKIIAELQSHRKEIEKLQTNASSASSSSPCRMRNPKQPSFRGSTQCEIGDLRCLVEGIHEFSRTMDELTCQLELANSLDGTGLGPGIGGLDFDQDTDDNFSEPERQDDKDLDDIHVDLCHACSKSVPLELETCLHRWGSLLTGSTLSLRKLRHFCSRLTLKLNKSGQELSEKRLLTTQLEEAVKHLGAKVDSTTEDVDKKSKELQELHVKLNENYKLVAELSSDNLRLSTEKAAAEQLLDEVKSQRELLREELNKAQKVVEQSMGQYHDWHPATLRPSSPETSASSFDFFPPSSPTITPGSNAHPGGGGKGQQLHKQSNRRGSFSSNRGRQKQRHHRQHGMKSAGVSSDYATESNPPTHSDSPKKRSLASRSLSNSNSGVTPPQNASDVSSPDLGVDLGSDPFSSLERANSISMGTNNIAAIIQENKRLKNDKERLSEKLSQSKEALRDTLDRLHKKDSTLSPLPSRRIFSSAVAAAVKNCNSTPKPPPSLKEEFIEFSRSHRFNKPNKKSKS